MDYYRWAFRPICIVSAFKSLIAFLVQKLLGCEQHAGWDWTLVTNSACFSKEGSSTYRHTHSGLSLGFDHNLLDRCTQVSFPLDTLCYFLPNVQKNSLPPAVSAALSVHTESKAFPVQTTSQY